MMLKIIPGEIFGHWTVIEEDYKKALGNKYYNCQCKCGKTQSLKATNLKKWPK